MKWLKFEGWLINPDNITHVTEHQARELRVVFVHGVELWLHKTTMAEFEAALKEARR